MATERGRREVLEWQALVAAVDALVGREVTIRVVVPGDPEELLVVARGRLSSRSDAKAPSLFWPLVQSDDYPQEEQPGIYLHEARVAGAERRAGGVLVIRQGAIVLNVRPLH